jgi:RHH-type proline utilization regulon transcriptional repressor/proline dehydrogenase/delta 1-pyrroline-5-carboxylate dehydrogenase
VAASLEDDVAALARRIAELEAGERRLFRNWWSDRMLSWAMSHPSFKTQLFRLVDVLPATTDSEDVVRHLHEYFDQGEIPKILDLGLDASEHVPGGKAIAAAVARRNVARMAGQFIVGDSPRSAVTGLHQIWRGGSAFTVDLLGEKTVTMHEGASYAGRVSELLSALVAAAAEWAPDEHLDRDDLGPIPRANLSLKPTALAPLYAPLTREEGLAQAQELLDPIMRRAVEASAFVYLDMEHYDVKDLTLDLFRRLLERAPEADAGVVLQAYLKDSHADLVDLIAWSSSRRKPVTVRLVKGAYWDSETITSRAAGWPVPVFESKAQTDANYERCVRTLHDAHGSVKAAFGSHNLRSLAYAVSYARRAGIPDHGYELQMLYGMAAPVQAAIRRMGLRLRLYCPVGELIPGMAYLVRRLLENTSNESFVRRHLAEGRAVEDLLSPAPDGSLPEREPPVRRPATDASRPRPYDPEPQSEWRRAGVRGEFAASVTQVQDRLGFEVPALIDGREVQAARRIESIDPSRPDIVVARAACCGSADVELAVAGAVRAWPGWRRTPARERAAVLFRAAEWMRSRRNALAALEIFEAAKPWPEADADVCEAIDFCEYYGREMIRLSAGGEVQSPPGEANSLRYHARGVGVVIAPWNFPLAIPAGMTAAALVAGNCVVLKPAEQSPATAWRLVEALRAAGLPAGVLQFLPGIGEEIGPKLVEHPAVSFIAFTGSKAVGTDIIERASVMRPGQRHVKRVIAEMGGKNAIVVDADADLDQAVPAIAYSAFGYAGQKCSAASRVVVVDPAHDDLVRRLAGAASAMVVGRPRDMSVSVGPLIDEDARRRVGSWVDLAAREGRIVVRREDVPAEGLFVGPTIVDDVPPDAKIANEEIFGPVLCVLRARTFAEAIAIANRTDYGLTAGVFSRSPAHIATATEELRAGNVYVNRAITGAVVGRQPFGGIGLSGVGSKAGGPDYLLQFMDPKSVSENTLRQGFAPEDA